MIPCPNPDCKGRFAEDFLKDAVFGDIEACALCERAFVFDGKDWVMLTAKEYVQLIPEETRERWARLYRMLRKERALPTAREVSLSTKS